MKAVSSPEEQRFARLFGRWLRGQREAAGLSQNALAQEAGVSRSLIAGVERGTYGISAARLARLAEILGSDVNEAMDLLAVARSAHLSGRLADPGPEYRLARIAEMHGKNVDEHGGTSGYCTECERAWPCPTFQWSTMEVDALCSNDLRDCALEDEDMPGHLRHDHTKALEAL